MAENLVRFEKKFKEDFNKAPWPLWLGVGVVVNDERELKIEVQPTSDNPMMTVLNSKAPLGWALTCGSTLTT